MLPENAYGRPGETANCFNAGEAVDGPIITRVRALARELNMNVVCT